MLFPILKNVYLISGNHLATPPNCLTTPQGVATPTLGTTGLEGSCLSRFGFVRSLDLSRVFRIFDSSGE